MNLLNNIVRSKGDPTVTRSGPSSLGPADRLARALGWFSIALGLAELLAPAQITRALGMEGKEHLVRGFGAREIGSGILSLSTDRQAGLWSRVAGDSLDIAFLVHGLRASNPKRANVTTALALLAAVTLLDMVGAQRVRTRHRRDRGRTRNYRDRSGFPRGVDAARGGARKSRAPADLRSSRPAEDPVALVP
jgi:hypothetical protein